MYHFENKANGSISNFASESGNKITDQKSGFITDQKSGFSVGRDGRGGRQFGAFRGRGRGRHPNQSHGRGSVIYDMLLTIHINSFHLLLLNIHTL